MFQNKERIKVTFHVAGFVKFIFAKKHYIIIQLKNKFMKRMYLSTPAFRSREKVFSHNKRTGYEPMIPKPAFQKEEPESPNKETNKQKIIYLPLLTFSNFNKKQIKPEIRIVDQYLVNNDPPSINDTNDFVENIKQAQQQQKPENPQFDSNNKIHGLIGDGVTNTFYSIYKNMKIQKRRQGSAKKKQGVKYLLEILEKYDFPPEKMNIIKEKGQEDILYFKNFGLASKRSKIIQEIGKKFSNFKVGVFSHNSLTDIQFLFSFKGLKELNLSDNHLGYSSIKSFKEFLSPRISLQNLNLQNNLLGDAAGQQLINQICRYEKMVILNLSKNALSLKTAKAIKNLLIQNTNLYQLYLHWNQFNDQSGKQIFEGLEKNTDLKVLDLSWNYLGGNLKIAQAISKSLQKVIVMHLDLSFCNFNQEQSKAIEVGIQKNNSIYGLHFQGNFGYINDKGFLIVQDHAEDFSQRNKYPLPVNSNKGMKRINSIQPNQNAYEFRSGRLSKDVCWICQSWVQVQFNVEYRDGPRGCRIHFDFDGYKGERLNPDGKIVRMCPRGQIKFFLSYGINQFYISKRYKKKSITQKLVNIQIDNYVVPKVNLSVINCQTIAGKHFIDINYNCQKKLIPRLGGNMKRKLKPTNNQNEIPFKTYKEFNFTNSPFCEWRLASDDIIDQCIQFDYENSKIKKLFAKNHNLSQIKKAIKPYYVIISTIYYHFANENRIRNFYSINSMRLQSLLVESMQICNQRLPIEMLTVIFASVLPKLHQFELDVDFTAKNVNTNFQPMYRAQFLELIFRIAYEKYSKKPKNYMIQKIRKYNQIKEQLMKQSPEKNRTDRQYIRKQRSYLPLEDGIIKITKKFQSIYQKIDPQPYRQKKIWTTESCLAITPYQTFLKALYNKFRNSKTKYQIKTSGMYFQDWISIFESLVPTDQERKFKFQSFFIYSKQLEIEEGIEPTSLQYCEFLESIIRASEFLSLPNFYKNDWDKIDPIYFPLAFKIENLIVYLYRRNMDLHTQHISRLIQREGIFQEEFIQFQHLIEKKKIVPWPINKDKIFDHNHAYKGLQYIIKFQQLQYKAQLEEFQKKQRQAQEEAKKLMKHHH